MSSRSVRQSVTMPAALAADVRRVARERHLTMSRALVVLAERDRKNEAWRDLIRAIFGKDSIAEDSVFWSSARCLDHLWQRVVNEESLLVNYRVRWGRDERHNVVARLGTISIWPTAPENAEWYRPISKRNVRAHQRGLETRQSWCFAINSRTCETRS